MNPRSRSTLADERPGARNEPETRLHGSWLVLARVGWLLLVVYTLALFVGSLPAYYTRLQMPCVGTVACSLNGALSAAGIQALQATGLSLSGYAAYTIALTIVVTLLWSAVGLVIFWRRSDDWVALLAALTLVLYNIGQQNTALTALALAHPAWTMPVEVATFLSEAPIVLFVLLFPGGRFAPRWTRWLVPLTLTQAICLIFLPADSPLNANNWPLALNGLLFIGFLLVAVFSQVYRYQRVSNAMQRQQIKWAVFGLILYAVLLIGLSLLALIPGLYQPGSLFEVVLNTLYPLAALPLPLSIGIAILRYRLWDIDTIINKALVYGLLTALLAAFYISLIIGLEGLAGAITGQAGQQSIVIVVSTLAIAALFQPLRKRIQSVIDRRFYRKKYDAAKTLAAFSATLRNEVYLEQLHEQLLVVVQETMQPAHVSLWLRKTERERKPNLDGNFSVSTTLAERRK
jgi:hypothetical protein